MKADDIDVARSYASFVSKGLVSLVGIGLETFRVPLHRIKLLVSGLETFRVPLHRIKLLVSGPVVGVTPSLLVQGIEMILGNDLAGGKVEPNPCVSDVPVCSNCEPVEAIPGLFPACAVTHAMAKKTQVQQSISSYSPLNITQSFGQTSYTTVCTRYGSITLNADL